MTCVINYILITSVYCLEQKYVTIFAHYKVYATVCRGSIGKNVKTVR